MAGSSLGLETQLLNQFTCGICKAQLRKPRALPCLHSFCEECLKSLCGDELFVQRITCPVCKQMVSVPGGNISNFPLDFLADRFLSVVMEICPDATTTSSPSHNTEKDKNYEMCYGHDKIKDMFCHSCNQVFCTECSPDHVDHAVGTVQDAAMSAVQNMTSLTNSARDRMPHLQENIEEIRQAIEEVETEHKQAEDGLIRSFDEMMRVLQHRKEDLLDELNDLKYDRASVLKMKRNELCATIKRSLELSQRVTECLEGDTDTELLKKEDELSDSLYRLINKCFVTKEDDVKVEFEYKAKMLTKALEAISNVGEIEFHIEGEEEAEEEEEEEEEGEEERHEETPSNEMVITSTSLEDLKDGNLVPELEEEEVYKDAAKTDDSVKTISDVDVAISENPTSTPQKENPTSTPYKEDDGKDTLPELVLSDTASTRTATTSSRLKERPPRRAMSTKDSNPCYEVLFNAPNTDTISRYRDISCIPIVELGGKGHERGQVYYPYGIAITQEAHLLVSDQGNSRVQLLDRCTGTSIMCFGREGNEQGHFNGPSGVTCHDGRYYVSDTGNDRVQIFGKDGSFIKSIGEGTLHSPRGITVSDDYIYIANSGMGNITVFDKETGDVVDKILNMSPHSCDLQLPTGVTRDNIGNIYFTDANNFFCNHFIQVLSEDHQYSQSIGVVGNKPGQFLGPSDLTIDNLGNIIIADTRNHRIQIVDNQNSLVACFGGFGRKKGLLHFPYGVCERDGALYVSDTNNHRIQVFNYTER